MNKNDFEEIKESFSKDLSLLRENLLLDDYLNEADIVKRAIKSTYDKGGVLDAADDFVKSGAKDAADAVVDKTVDSIGGVLNFALHGMYDAITGGKKFRDNIKNINTLKSKLKELQRFSDKQRAFHKSKILPIIKQIEISNQKALQLLRKTRNVQTTDVVVKFYKVVAANAYDKESGQEDRNFISSGGNKTEAFRNEFLYMPQNQFDKKYGANDLDTADKVFLRYFEIFREVIIEGYFNGPEGVKNFKEFELEFFMQVIFYYVTFIHLFQDYFSLRLRVGFDDINTSGKVKENNFIQYLDKERNNVRKELENLVKASRERVKKFEDEVTSWKPSPDDNPPDKSYELSDKERQSENKEKGIKFTEEGDEKKFLEAFFETSDRFMVVSVMDKDKLQELIRAMQDSIENANQVIYDHHTAGLQESNLTEAEAGKKGSKNDMAIEHHKRTGPNKQLWGKIEKIDDIIWKKLKTYPEIVEHFYEKEVKKTFKKADEQNTEVAFQVFDISKNKKISEAYEYLKKEYIERGKDAKERGDRRRRFTENTKIPASTSTGTASRDLKKSAQLPESIDEPIRILLIKILYSAYLSTFLRKDIHSLRDLSAASKGYRDLEKEAIKIIASSLSSESSLEKTDANIGLNDPYFNKSVMRVAAYNLSSPIDPKIYSSKATLFNNVTIADVASRSKEDYEDELLKDSSALKQKIINDIRTVRNDLSHTVKKNSNEKISNKLYPQYQKALEEKKPLGRQFAEDFFEEHYYNFFALRFNNAVLEAGEIRNENFLLYHFDYHDKEKGGDAGVHTTEHFQEFLNSKNEDLDLFLVEMSKNDTKGTIFVQAVAQKCLQMIGFEHNSFDQIRKNPDLDLKTQGKFRQFFLPIIENIAKDAIDDIIATNNGKQKEDESISSEDVDNLAAESYFENIGERLNLLLEDTPGERIRRAKAKKVKFASKGATSQNKFSDDKAKFGRTIRKAARAVGLGSKDDSNAIRDEIEERQKPDKSKGGTTREKDFNSDSLNETLKNGVNNFAYINKISLQFAKRIHEFDNGVLDPCYRFFNLIKGERKRGIKPPEGVEEGQIRKTRKEDANIDFDNRRRGQRRQEGDLDSTPFDEEKEGLSDEDITTAKHFYTNSQFADRREQERRGQERRGQGQERRGHQRRQMFQYRGGEERRRGQDRREREQERRGQGQERRGQGQEGENRRTNNRPDQRPRTSGNPNRETDFAHESRKEEFAFLSAAINAKLRLHTAVLHSAHRHFRSSSQLNFGSKETQSLPFFIVNKNISLKRGNDEDKLEAVLKNLKDNSARAMANNLANLPNQNRNYSRINNTGQNRSEYFLRNKVEKLVKKMYLEIENFGEQFISNNSILGKAYRSIHKEYLNITDNGRVSFPKATYGIKHLKDTLDTMGWHKTYSKSEPEVEEKETDNTETNTGINKKAAQQEKKEEQDRKTTQFFNAVNTIKNAIENGKIPRQEVRRLYTELRLEVRKFDKSVHNFPPYNEYVQSLKPSAQERTNESTKIKTENENMSTLTEAIENLNKENSNLQEGAPTIRWRRNPRTHLNKIVMTCKKDEYKKPRGRKFKYAGQEINDVMCMPKASKPASQKAKERKSSIKRWRKIKANPTKMKRMKIRKAMTKKSSKTVRKG